MSDIKKPNTSTAPSKQEYLASKTPDEHLKDFFQMHLPLIHSVVHNWHTNNAQGMSDESGNPIDPEDLHIPAYHAFHQAVSTYNPERKSGPQNKSMSWNNYLNQQIRYKLQKYRDDVTGYSKNKAAAGKIGGQSKD